MPETTVAAIITREDGRVLLTRRAGEPFKGQWCLPGGHIDKNEHVRDAVIREVHEEVELQFDPHFFAFFDEIIPKHDIHNVVIVFTGIATGTVRNAADEVEASGWFSFEQARAMSIAFLHGDILAAYAKSEEL